MTDICLLCVCRLQVNSGCSVKQKKTFALMISCAASLCPYRFVATHVHMLRCWVPESVFWGQSCSVVSPHMVLFQLKWLCVLCGPARICVNACCDFHSVSDSVNIPSLVCSEHLQLLSLSSASPRSHAMPLPLSIFPLTFSSGLYSGRNKTNEHKEEVEKDDRRYVIDVQRRY